MPTTRTILFRLVGGNNCCGTPTLAGPKDQRPIESRDDVLVYTSEALQSPVAIAGPGEDEVVRGDRRSRHGLDG